LLAAVAIPIPATPERTVLAISKRQSFVIEISLDLRMKRDRLDGNPKRTRKGGFWFHQFAAGRATSKLILQLGRLLTRPRPRA
jgi:hypothetical protein